MIKSENSKISCNENKIIQQVIPAYLYDQPNMRKNIKLKFLLKPGYLNFNSFFNDHEKNTN